MDIEGCLQTLSGSFPKKFNRMNHRQVHSHLTSNGIHLRHLQNQLNELFIQVLNVKLGPGVVVSCAFALIMYERFGATILEFLFENQI